MPIFIRDTGTGFPHSAPLPNGLASINEKTTRPTDEASLISNHSSASDIAHKLLSVSGLETSSAEAQQHLANDIDTLTADDRAFTHTLAESAELIRVWHEELTSWHWLSDLLPDRQSHENFTKANSVNARKHRKLAEIVIPSNPRYLDASNLHRHEDRLKEIKQDLDELDIEAQKSRALKTESHFSPDELDASPSPKDPWVRNHHQSLPQTIVLIVNQTMPIYSQLLSLLEEWQVRLNALKKLSDFWSLFGQVQIQSKNAWLAIGIKRDSSSGIRRAGTIKLGSRGLFRASFERIRDNMEGVIANLGQYVDSLLEYLESQNMTLPETWVQSVDDLELDYSRWVAEAQKKVLQYERRSTYRRSYNVEAEQKHVASNRPTKIVNHRKPTIPGTWFDEDSDSNAAALSFNKRSQIAQESSFTREGRRLDEGDTPSIRPVSSLKVEKRQTSRGTEDDLEANRVEVVRQQIRHYYASHTDLGSTKSPFGEIKARNTEEIASSQHVNTGATKQRSSSKQSSPSIDNERGLPTLASAFRFPNSDQGNEAENKGKFANRYQSLRVTTSGNDDLTNEPTTSGKEYREFNSGESTEHPPTKATLSLLLEGVPSGEFPAEPFSRTRLHSLSPCRQSLSTAEQLEKHLESILTTTAMPVVCRKQATRGKERSSITSNDYQRLSIASTSYYLTPAFHGEKRPSFLSRHSDIKFYHLTVPQTQQRLNIFLRLAGEGGHQVMVRTQSGWTDFGNWLRHFTNPRSRVRHVHHHSSSVEISPSSVESAPSLCRSSSSMDSTNAYSRRFRRSQPLNSDEPTVPDSSVHTPANLPKRTSSAKPPDIPQRSPSRPRTSSHPPHIPPIRSLSSRRRHSRNISAPRSSNHRHSAIIDGYITSLDPISQNTTFQPVPKPATHSQTRHRATTSFDTAYSPLPSYFNLPQRRRTVDTATASTKTSKLRPISKYNRDFSSTSKPLPPTPPPLKGHHISNSIDSRIARGTPQHRKRDSWVIGREIVDVGPGEVSDEDLRFVRGLMERAERRWSCVGWRDEGRKGGVGTGGWV